MSKEAKNSIENFYNSLAGDYHLVYGNWSTSIKNQCKVIHQLIRKYAKGQPTSILDCTCGIGTQALGLSELGYEVFGTDVSPVSIERAKQEAQKRNLAIAFEDVDVRALEKHVKGTFDLVISFDNSLPHLKREEDLQTGAENIFSKVCRDGLFIGSIRDYDRLLVQKPTSTTPVRSTQNGIMSISFQLWDWQENHIYTVNHFTLKGRDGEFTTTVRKVTYRAYTRAEINSIFKAAGFQKIDWLLPSETGFYQPIFLAQK